MRYEIKIPILFLDMNNIKNKFLRIKNLNRTLSRQIYILNLF